MPTRRKFLRGAAAAVAAATIPPRSLAAANLDPRSWSSVRAQFALDPRATNFATFLLAPHPKVVRDAIDHHRRLLDRDAKRYLDAQEQSADRRVRKAAAAYLHVDEEEIALTDSTTMGLGLLYGGLILRPGQEVLTTVHDFYSTHEALRLRALRAGASVRKVRLYQNARSMSTDEVVSAVQRAVAPETRALAITWVHSSTGVKLPVRAIADALQSINANRPPGDRVLLCVDGVHGFGVEAATPAELGCDFLVSGCHKWLFGPRGTGVIWGRAEAWAAVTPTIPSFDLRAITSWIQGQSSPQTGISGLPRALALTPGGFHSFEHRWALKEALDFRRRIGAARAATRTHQLTARLKQGLAEIKAVQLVTPQSPAHSAGLVCFGVANRDPAEFVDALWKKSRIVGSVTPYASRYVRFGPSILNTTHDVDVALRTIRALA